MSKTVRRKNNRWDERDFVDAWYYNYEHEVCFLYHNNLKEHAKRLAQYHSDKFNFHAPKYFRQILNREFRLKNKAILNHAIRNDIDPILIPFIKNADWNYF